MASPSKPTRENRTITVDFQDETTYLQLLGNTKAFVECVLAFLLALGFRMVPASPRDIRAVLRLPSFRSTIS
jgi:hypothetical protein